MAILRVQTTTAREGKTEEFNSMVREGSELMNSKGINTVVRVSHSGTENIEVYSINFFVVVVLNTFPNNPSRTNLWVLVPSSDPVVPIL